MPRWSCTWATVCLFSIGEGPTECSLATFAWHFFASSVHFKFWINVNAWYQWEWPTAVHISRHVINKCIFPANQLNYSRCTSAGCSSAPEKSKSSKPQPINLSMLKDSSGMYTIYLCSTSGCCCTACSWLTTMEPLLKHNPEWGHLPNQDTF